MSYMFDMFLNNRTVRVESWWDPFCCYENNWQVLHMLCIYHAAAVLNATAWAAAAAATALLPCFFAGHYVVLVLTPAQIRVNLCCCLHHNMRQHMQQKNTNLFVHTDLRQMVLLLLYYRRITCSKGRYITFSTSSSEASGPSSAVTAGGSHVTRAIMTSL